VSDRLKHLAKNGDIDDPDSVNMFIARKQCLNSHKESYVKAYKHYADSYKIAYVKPRFKCERKLPRIPTKEAIMNIISASSKRYSIIFRLLMETGVMPFELANVSRRDIDFDRQTIAVRGFKGHNSRVFKLEDETTAMLKEYLTENCGEKPFPDADCMGSVWRRVRNKLAQKLRDPGIKCIRLYGLRHF
jgi:integrase